MTMFQLNLDNQLVCCVTVQWFKLDRNDVISFSPLYVVYLCIVCHSTAFFIILLKKLPLNSLKGLKTQTY